MNIRDDKRETIKYYSLLALAKIFFIAAVIINPDIKTALLLVFGVLIEGWAEEKNYKIAQSNPQDLKDGVKYIFCGADTKNNFLFLEEHIHEEVRFEEDRLFKTKSVIYDYDKPGIFNGQLFTLDLKIGETVIKHELEKDYVGIIRFEEAI